MGVARGSYSFMSHLKYTPLIVLGYIAAIAAHFLINGHMESIPMIATDTSAAHH